MVTQRKTALEKHRQFVAGYIAKQSQQRSDKRRELENKTKVEQPTSPSEKKQGKTALKNQ